MLSEYRDIFTQRGIHVEPGQPRAPCETIVDILYRIHHIGHEDKKSIAHKTTTQSHKDHENNNGNDVEDILNTEEYSDEDAHGDTSDVEKTDDLRYETGDEPDNWRDGSALLNGITSVCDSVEQCGWTQEHDMSGRSKWTMRTIWYQRSTRVEG